MNLNTVRFDETRGGIVFFFFFFLTLSKKFFIGISPPSVTLSLSPRSSFLPPLPLPSFCFFSFFYDTSIPTPSRYQRSLFIDKIFTAVTYTITYRSVVRSSDNNESERRE